MNEELLKLIYRYTITGKEIDKEFIDKIVEIVVTTRNFKEYVAKTDITDTLEKTHKRTVCAVYRPKHRIILVDFGSFQIMRERMRCYECLFNNLEQRMFRNLMIAKIILHELEHAHQSKIADEKSDGTDETELIKASYQLFQVIKPKDFVQKLQEKGMTNREIVDYIHREQELARQYYVEDPTERLAQFRSNGTILNIMEPIRTEVPRLYDFEYATLIEQLLIAYEKVWKETTNLCPTDTYLLGTGKSDLWYNFDFYDPDLRELMKKVTQKYNLIQRLYLGLPIWRGEYQATSEWLQTTNKYKI